MPRITKPEEILMPDENIVFKNIEKLGERYCREHLNMNKEELENDWWEALKFFFGRSFFRGRRDKLSKQYYCFTIDRLRDFFQIKPNDLDGSYQRIKGAKEQFDSKRIQELKDRFRRTNGKGSFTKNHDFYEKMIFNNELIKCLTTVKTIQVEWEDKTDTVKRKLDNEEDIMMVLGTLKFISNENKRNIYTYLKQAIQSNGAEHVYSELKNIRAIGDKIASFIIRDIGLLNPGLITKEFNAAFPVDTWVEQVAKKLRCQGKDKDIIPFFIERCKNLGISPLKFAAGLWYLGFKSLDLAFEYLNKVEVDTKR